MDEKTKAWAAIVEIAAVIDVIERYRIEDDPAGGGETTAAEAVAGMFEEVFPTLSPAAIKELVSDGLEAAIQARIDAED